MNDNLPYDAIDRWASRHVARCHTADGDLYLDREGQVTSIVQAAARYRDSITAWIAITARWNTGALPKSQPWEPYPAIGLPEGDDT